MDTQDLVKKWKEQQELRNCPIANVITKSACEKRQRKLPHWVTNEATEIDIPSLEMMFCAHSKCEHYKPPEKRKGKLSLEELNDRRRGWRKPTKD